MNNLQDNCYQVIKVFNNNVLLVYENEEEKFFLVKVLVLENIREIIFLLI